MNPNKCADDVYINGTSLGLFDMTKEQANEHCQKETTKTGNKHDWHFVAGRVHIKVLINTTTKGL